MTQQADFAALHAPQQRQPGITVHGFVQAVIEGLLDQWVVWYLTFTDDVFQAGQLVGEHRGDQVFAFHSLNLRRHLAPAGVARQCQRGASVPAPTHPEQRCIEYGLDKYLFGRGRVQVAPDVIQFKTVGGRERQHDRVFAGGGL